MNIITFGIHKGEAYKKAIKLLTKRFRRVESDVKEFIDGLQTLEDLGTPLGQGIYKARLKNSDKPKGKSGSYRLITLLKVVESKIYLVYIFDKSDYENLSDADLLELVSALLEQ